MNIERRMLKNLFLELRDMKIPKFSQNDKVDDCVEQIIELDSYYAGLALSTSESKKPFKENLYDIRELKKKILI